MGLAEIYSQYSSPDGGGDKGTAHSYIDIYAERIKPGIAALLEIGVWEGQSLAMWQKYLPGTLVLGLDTDKSRLKYDVFVRQVDATFRADVDWILGEQKFDVIIDDGSHRLADQLASFDILFERVVPGGYYFIEDIAGTESLQALEQMLISSGLSYSVYDLRENKGRWDDILVEVRR